MTQASLASNTSSPEDPDKLMREKVDKLLARSPYCAEGTTTLAGSSVAYRTVAEFIPIAAGGLDGKRGDPEAAIFTVAYLHKDTKTSDRPVCFAFNGGPGSASVILNLGALGPKRAVIHDDGTMPAPPYQVVDNPQSWFEHFDLVFIDPPHTGYSMTASEKARKRMLGIDGDIAALSECMRAWLTRHRRWGSTLYVAGESYGTTRAAGIADKLQELGIALSGLILVSCAMDLQSLVFAPRNDLPYALFLPAFACVAQYHGKLEGAMAASPEAAREAAEHFVLEEYLPALHAGSRLSESKRRHIGRRVAELSGLAASLVEEKNLRISDETFFFELLRDRGLIVGRLEARVTGPMALSRTRAWEFDPGIEALLSPYTMAANAYMSEGLGIDAADTYEIFSADAHKQWNWNRGEEQGNAFASTSPDLSRALRRNPHLRLFVASGYYDLGTPYSASDWSIAQLDIPAEVRVRVEHHYYGAGHMMYTRETDLHKLKQDLEKWLAASGS
ncbi:MAG: peptidase S10 [Burkholderiaceae bacterium]|jgi:carboxypeptidase C (cathepsin A)